MTLRRQTFSAVRWTTLDSAGKALLRVASIAVLARILAPEDYGLMAIVSVILGLASMFADLGMNSAYVQRKDVTQEQRSSLYWLNVAMSACLAVLLVAISPLVATFYGDPRLSPLIMLSASTIVFIALGQQVKMSAEKELRFAGVVSLSLIASLIGFAVAILAALAGWGVYALVVSVIAGAALSSAFYWIFVADGWRPMWRLRKDDIQSFLGFGSATVGNNVASYLGRSADIFLGGRLLGASDLGLFSVPRTLVLELGGMVNAIVTRVGFPLIAKVQSDIDRVRSIYLKTMNMTAATNAPLYIGIAFFAPDIVTLVLGEGWEKSGELFRVLALWGGLRSTGNPVGSLLYGMGRAGLSLKWNMWLLLIVPPAVWLGSQNGAVGIAWALLLVQVVLFVPAWFFLVRPVCKAKLIDYSVAALRPFVLAALAVGPAYVVASQLDDVVARLFVGVLISAPLYWLFSWVGNREWVLAMLELLGRKAD